MERLAVLLRVGGQHIAGGDWTTFLQAAKTSGIDSRLVIVLMLSLAGKGAALRKRPDTVAVETSTMHSEDIHGTECAALICATGMKQLMHVERSANVSNVVPIQPGNSSGWMQLVKLFSAFDPFDQVDLLLRVKPRASDGAKLSHAFDALIDMHLAGLVASGGFPYLNGLLWIQPRKRLA